MKKNITLLFLLFCCFFFVKKIQAQGTVFFPNKGGLSLSMTSTNVFLEHNYGSGLNDYIFTPGISAGLQGEWILSKNKASFIGVELLYSAQGQKYGDWKIIRDTAFQFLKNQDLNYIKLPFYYKKIYTDKNRCVKYFYNVGLYAAYLQSANLQFIRRGIEVTFVQAMTEKNPHEDFITQPESTKALYRNLDFGLVGGWGAQQQINDKMTAMMEVRTEIGFMDINDGDWRFEHPRFGYRPSINTSLGLKFSLLYNFK